MKLFTAILLLSPAYFIALAGYFASAGLVVVFASAIGLNSVACFAWGIRIFRSHRKLAWLCFVVAALYLINLALMLQPAKAKGANQAASGNGAITLLFNVGRHRRVVPEQQRWTERAAARNGHPAILATVLNPKPRKCPILGHLYPQWPLSRPVHPLPSSFERGTTVIRR